MDRIAYIGEDGNLYTIRPDGADRQRLTSEASVPFVQVLQAQRDQENRVFYTWPTWSPDGRNLAVSRVATGGPSGIVVGIYSISIATGAATKLYENPPDAAPLIAANVPHYMYWSPDGTRLAFIAQSSGGLALFVSPLVDPDRLTTVISGAPLYLAWGTDSRVLLVHAGEALLLSDLDTPSRPNLLPPQSSSFRVPAWSPDGSRMAYIDQTPKGNNALFLADADGENGQPLTGVGPDGAFLWSPDQARIAFTDTSDASPPYRGLKVVDTVKEEVRSLTDESVLAFFWSPDGTQIAYVAHDPTTRMLSWKVVSPAQGGPRKLVDFVPSQDLSTLLVFFDQYAYSHTLWAPDSRHLVFAGEIAPRGPGGNGAAGGSRVYIIDVDNPGSPTAIATGSLAFWSWN